MNASKGQSYTAKNLRIELLLLQRHLSDYITEIEDKRARGLPTEPDDDTDFCLECVEQHFLAIEGFCQEALSFFDETSVFTAMGRWAADAGEHLNKFNELMAWRLRDEAREHRKKLTAQTSECEPCKRLAERFAQNVASQEVMRGSAV